MDLWERARRMAEEAAKRSEELRVEAGRRYEDFSIGSSKISHIVSQASNSIKLEALKRADQIKSHIPPTAPATPHEAEEDLDKFGVTTDLREFVKDITINTFRHFPLGGPPLFLYNLCSPLFDWFGFTLTGIWHDDDGYTSFKFFFLFEQNIQYSLRGEIILGYIQSYVSILLALWFYLILEILVHVFDYQSCLLSV